MIDVYIGSKINNKIPPVYSFDSSSELVDILNLNGISFDEYSDIVLDIYHLRIIEKVIDQYGQKIQKHNLLILRNLQELLNTESIVTLIGD